MKQHTALLYCMVSLALSASLFSVTAAHAEGEKLKQLANQESGRHPGGGRDGSDRSEPRRDDRGGHDRHERGNDHGWNHGGDHDRDRGWDHGRDHRRDHARDRDHWPRPEHAHRHPPAYSHPPRYVPPQRPHHYVDHLPFGFVRLLIHELEYFYGDGIFYRPYAEGFVVTSAPLGAVVATLPYGYSVVNTNGAQYYVVNDTYYLPYVNGGYQVVSNPTAVPFVNPVINPAPVLSAQPVQPGSLYVYPQNGQTADQQARDEYECHTWGVQQSGFDPHNSAGIQSVALTQEYQRAMSACLAARGYSVR